MKLRRLRPLVIAAALLTVAGLFLLYVARHSREAVPQLLAASPPVLAFVTNATGRVPVISFCLSNGGPADVDYCLPWFECKAHSDLKLIAAKSLDPRVYSRSLPLLRRTATNLLMTLSTDAGLDPAPLFCCQVGWLERESRPHYYLRKATEPMYWLTAFFDFNWNPPWRNQVFASGDLFISNIQTADYFRRAYGFTAEKWWQELRLQEQRQAKQEAELARLRSQGLIVAVGAGHAATFSLEEQLTLDAKAAFANFCRASTNSGKSVSQR
jgi:hypothetical protein